MSGIWDHNDLGAMDVIVQVMCISQRGQFIVLTTDDQSGRSDGRERFHHVESITGDKIPVKY